jgi:hypothetical protein
MSICKTVTAMAFATLLSACNSGTSENANSSNATTTKDGQANSAWNIKNETDPMTDNSVITAKRTFEVEPFRVEATLACSTDGIPRYSFLTFSAEGEGAQARTNVYDMPEIQVRVDSAPARNFDLASQPYSNAFNFPTDFEISTYAMNKGQPNSYLAKLATAKRILFRFKLMNGEPLVEIDQTDSGLQTIMQECQSESQEPSKEPESADEAMEVPKLQGRDIKEKSAFSSYFDIPNGKVGDARCTVAVKGMTVFEGNCTANTEDNRVILFNENDGCTLDIFREGKTVRAGISAYRDTCTFLDDNPDIAEKFADWGSLGKVTRNGNCWANANVRACATPR